MEGAFDVFFWKCHSDFYRRDKFMKDGCFSRISQSCAVLGGCETFEAARLIDHLLQMVRPGPILRESYHFDDEHFQYHCMILYV